MLLAVPGGATEATLKSIKHLVTPEMLIMDVGSTKADVVQAARNALGSQLAAFVPAHPNTGKEVAGVEHADAQLYRGAKVILTPTERTLTSHLHKAEALWQALGCDVSSMRPSARCRLRHRQPPAPPARLCHDAQRHRPAPGRCLPERCRPWLSAISPASPPGDPAMWRDILLANQDEVLAQSSTSSAPCRPSSRRCTRATPRPWRP